MSSVNKPLLSHVVLLLFLFLVAGRAVAQNDRLPDISLKTTLADMANTYVDIQTQHAPAINDSPISSLISSYVNDTPITYASKTLHHKNKAYVITPFLLSNRRIFIAVDVIDSATKNPITGKPHMAMIDLGSNKQVEFGFGDPAAAESLSLIIQPTLAHF